MPDCVLANRTDLDRAVDRVLLVFGSLSGFALVKFATTTMSKELDGPWVVWPLAIALTAFLLRFILGSSIHLNQSFVKNVKPENITCGLIALFIKDLFFIIAFGLIAVGLTECQSIDTFILWSTIFVTLGFVWGVVDWLARRCPGDWGRLETDWLKLDALQALLFFLIYLCPAAPQHHYIKAAIFAVVSIIFLVADITFLLEKRPPERSSAVAAA